MSTFDIIVLIPLVWGAYKGYRKGLLIELTNMVAFILGIIVSFKLLDLAISLLRSWLGDIGIPIPLLAFISTFILVVVGINALGKIIKQILDITLIGYLDDFAGACLGILKWAFGISLILWLLSQAQIPLPVNWIQDSVLYSYMVVYSPKLIDVASNLLPFAKDLVHNISELFQ